MSGSFDDQGRLDTDRGVIVTCLGKKRSGKSVMALYLFWSYPYDRAVLDVAGDDGPMGAGVFTLAGDAETLPEDWPEHLRQYDDQGKPKPMTIRYVPDAGSPTFLADCDAFLGLVWRHGGCCLLIHETGRVAMSNQTPANMLRILQHNRHQGITAIFAQPRALTVNTLVISQADVLNVFELPSRDDRKRVAETIGWPLDDFDSAVHALGPHERLEFDANAEKPAEGEDDTRMMHLPALPPDVVAAVERWADPQGVRQQRRAKARLDSGRVVRL